MANSLKMFLRPRRIAVWSIVAVGLIVFVPKATVWWYGYDFESAVVDAVTDVSSSSEYCIYDEDKNILVSDFAELDKEQILKRAFFSSLRHSRVDSSRWRKHHFRIVVGTKTYYWSFKQSEFHFENRSGFQLVEQLRESCAAYLSFPEQYQSAFRERDNLVVSKTNFCCHSVGSGAVSL